MGKPIPVFMMNSFSRSGETMMLRALAAHSRIGVVHQLLEPDDKRDLRIFRELMQSPKTSLDVDSELLAHRGVTEGDVLVLKNAVWVQREPWNGFVFIRNPFSVMHSARVTREETEDSYKVHREQVRRWGKNIDGQMTRHMLSVDNLEAFCLLYARKMVDAYVSGAPIVRYEDFVVDPERWLRLLTDHFGLPWEDRVVHAHEDYSEGEYGHGKIPLWKPIHAGSLGKYSAIPDDAKAKIYALTAPIFDLYGYRWTDGVVETDEIDHRFNRE